MDAWTRRQIDSREGWQVALAQMSRPSSHAACTPWSAGVGAAPREVARTAWLTRRSLAATARPSPDAPAVTSTMAERAIGPGRGRPRATEHAHARYSVRGVRSVRENLGRNLTRPSYM
jgi:hypothetical protein